MRSLLPLLLISGLGLGLTACDKPRIVASACRNDDDCEGGNLCDNYECVPREAKACEVVIEGNPILQPSPHTVDFGEVDAQTALVQTITIHNIGNCTLTLFEATLADPAAGFTCDLCDTTFPKEIWPGRSLDIELSYTPNTVKQSATELTLLSDDKEYGTLRVPVKARYIGTPSLVASPTPVDFGYAPQGRQVRRTVTLSNQGTGTAPVTITDVRIEPAGTMDFALVPITTLPRELVPVTEDRSAVQTFEVRYTPRSSADHTAELVITSSKGTITVPMAGTASAAPQAGASPLQLDLGNVTLGTSAFATLTITNNMGGAPLKVTPVWGGQMFTTDFSITPQLIPDIAPNGYTEVQVQVTATREGLLQAILNLETNDPMKPVISIPVRATGVLGAGGEVVKIEMTYDNGADNAFDNDVRNVDMTLEHPYGYVCNKQTPNPMNWGNFGTASWLAFAPKEEPERIILADSRQDGTYRVQVSYMEDCASLPTELMAGILGISVEALLGYLTGGITIPGQDVGDLIQSICFDKSSTAVTIRVFINGTLTAERNAQLGRKGDTTYVLDLVRNNATFSVP